MIYVGMPFKYMFFFIWGIKVLARASYSQNLMEQS